MTDTEFRQEVLKRFDNPPRARRPPTAPPVPQPVGTGPELNRNSELKSDTGRAVSVGAAVGRDGRRG